MQRVVNDQLGAWLEQLIYNTSSQFPSGGWGLGLTNANLNTVRQTLQAYFAVGLANFGFGMGQQLGALSRNRQELDWYSKTLQVDPLHRDSQRRLPPSGVWSTLGHDPGNRF